MIAQQHDPALATHMVSEQFMSGFAKANFTEWLKMHGIKVTDPFRKAELLQPVTEVIKNKSLTLAPTCCTTCTYRKYTTFATM
jgi:hypothetical protein